MKLINRIALIVTPQQPLLDWITGFSDESLPSLSELQQESSTYLLDEPVQEQQLDKLLLQLTAQHYQQIWDSELAIWDENLDHRPQDFTLDHFKMWFKVSLSGLTFDLGKQKLMVADVNDG